MWLLTSEHATDDSVRGKTIALLLDKDKYEVGRDTACDFPLTDQGASRKHAILFPVKDNVKLEDQKSKYGTFVNDEKERIPKDAHTFLKDNDLIFFGRRENAWRLKKVEISVITTKLDPRDNLELKSLLRVLNGNQVLSDWSNIVTHLVSPDVTFTTKFLLAMVNCVPIVNLDFFRDAVAHVRTSGTLPDVTKYTPTTTPDFPELCDFSVKAERKGLFSGLAFTFLSQLQMNTFQKIITCAGGSVSMWDKKKSSIIRVASRVIGDSKTEPDHQEVANYLLGKGRRLIPATEIGMAIATVSIEKHCNPKYNPEVGHILALETPFVQGCNSSDVICMEEVPETIVVDDDDEDVTAPAVIFDKAADKTRMRVCDKTVVSNTEVPETATVSEQRVTNQLFQFPDDDDDDSFNERSQQILDLVDQHSSQASNKRKHSGGTDAENEQPPQAKKPNSQIQNVSLASRFNSSQFIARPSQKLQSQATDSRPPPTRSAPEQVKRTLADLLAKDEDDSEDELLNFKKKSKATDTTRGAKKPVPTLLRSVDEPDKSNSELDGPSKPLPEVERVRISQLSGWLSKTLQSNCSIKVESLDETRAWIAPLLNCVQVKDIIVDLSNCSRNRTGNTTEGSLFVAANLSGKRNFKSFKKQSFHKNSLLDPELTRTKSVLITEKL